MLQTKFHQSCSLPISSYSVNTSLNNGSSNRTVHAIAAQFTNLAFMLPVMLSAGKFCAKLQSKHSDEFSTLASLLVSIVLFSLDF